MWRLEEVEEEHHGGCGGNVKGTSCPNYDRLKYFALYLCVCVCVCVCVYVCVGSGQLQEVEVEHYGRLWRD